MWRLGLACPLVCAALSACGGGPPEAGTPLPKTQAVPDSKARTLLMRAFHAARPIGREDGACRGCYPTDASEITEDMNARTGDEYAAAATSFDARLPGVVYVDTTGAGRLARGPDHALRAHVERDDLASCGRHAAARISPGGVTARVYRLNAARMLGAVAAQPRCPGSPSMSSIVRSIE